MKRLPPKRLGTVIANRQRSSSLRITRNLVLVALITLAVASCENSDGNRDGRFISVDREVILAGIHGGTTAVTRLAGGELVITGKARTAWVITTDSQGTLLWKYQDPVDEKNSVQVQSQTEYHAMVPLANGNILLCGNRNFTGGQKDLILILDRKGKLIEQREEIPGVDRPMVRSNFQKCMAWNGGGLLLGTVSNESVDHQWVLTVDSSGKKSGEGFFNLTDATAGNSNEPSVLYDLPDMADKWSRWLMYRVSSQGKIVATREVTLSQVNPVTTTLRTIESTSNLQVVGVPLGKKLIMYTLNSRLEDVVPPREIYNIDTTQGMGYVRLDGSLVLFGKTSGAAIAWVDSTGQLMASHVFNSKYQSSTVLDAVPVSANQFVTIRDGITQDSNDRGLLMDWVTLNQKP